MKLEHRNFVNVFSKLFNANALMNLRIEIEDMSFEDHKVSVRDDNALRRGEGPDSVRLKTRWYEPWKQLSNHIILNPFRYVLFPCQVRKMSSKEHLVPWHQDRAYMALLGNRAPAQVLTCFVPLNERPEEHTSIEFALTSSEDIIKHEPIGEFSAGINFNYIDTQHYALKLGDALVFGDAVIHRSFSSKDLNINRISLEFRLTQACHVVPSRDYFDLETKRFVYFDASLNYTDSVLNHASA